VNRDDMLSRMIDVPLWDILIIGGGATGVGIAVDAASRGYKTLLIEKGDFAQGTSSRSTKLAHGGVRYLQQGNVSLVMEALKERGILRRNAPHLVHNLRFIVPNYDWWEGPFYGVGMKIYDLMAGKEGFGKSRMISKQETLSHLPNIETEGLNGGVIYFDGQFDDSRLVISLALTAEEQGAVLLNYMPVTKLHKENGKICGVTTQDLETGGEYKLNAKVVINATGPFSDSIRQMDDQQVKPMVSPSQGIHLVFEKSFLPGDTAIMVPNTTDGRVLFAIPWHDRVVVGTTETTVDSVKMEPVPQQQEIEFILENAAKYLKKDPTYDDILSVFAGVRPLVSDPNAKNSAAISRDHVVNISPSGLLTIAGGKWTTYRKMAEDTLAKAIKTGDLIPQECVTETLQVHGYHKHPHNFGKLECFGSDAIEIRKMISKKPSLAEKLHPEMAPIEAEVIWAVRYEMARNVIDFLSRRRRSLILDAKKSIQMAQRVAELMAEELGKDSEWQQQQVSEFNRIAKNYVA